MDDSGVLGGFDWEGMCDITALPEEALKDELEVLTREEKAAGYRLSVLQGRRNLVRADLVKRGLAALGPEDLARALLGAPEDGEQR